VNAAPVLELCGVSLARGGVPVLEDFSLAVAAQRTTVLIGRSGCGKSTILKLFVGLLTPDRGSVRFQGRVLGGAALAAQRQRMGYVIQDGGLFPHLRGRDNASLLARHLGWPAARIEARLAELAALTRLEPALLDRYPAELSGGQRQRLALVRALMLDPQVLLLDEPLGALDPLIRFDLQTELQSIFATLRKTVVLVTHDLAEAAHFGAEIVLVERGRIAQRGSMRELLEAPASEFVDRFVRAQRVPAP